MTDDAMTPIEDALAKQALLHHEFVAEAMCLRVCVSENATYLVGDFFTERRMMLRIYSAKHRDRSAIDAELDWMEAVGRDVPQLTIPSVVPTPDGRRVVELIDDCGQRRFAVAFTEIGGEELSAEKASAAQFLAIGQAAGRLHAHAATWAGAKNLPRARWDFEHTLGEQHRWAPWHNGVGVTATHQQALAPMVRVINEALAGYGWDRFGLIHADLRLANVLKIRGGYAFIDFDDCGFGWHLYDYAAAFSFMEMMMVDDPVRFESLHTAWLKGYKKGIGRSLPMFDSVDMDMLPIFVMLRRLMLLGWLGEHQKVVEISRYGTDFADETVRLGRTILPA